MMLLTDPNRSFGYKSKGTGGPIHSQMIKSGRKSKNEWNTKSLFSVAALEYILLASFC